MFRPLKNFLSTLPHVLLKYIMILYHFKENFKKLRHEVWISKSFTYLFGCDKTTLKYISKSNIKFLNSFLSTTLLFGSLVIMRALKTLITAWGLDLKPKRRKISPKVTAQASDFYSQRLLKLYQ